MRSHLYTYVHYLQSLKISTLRTMSKGKHIGRHDPIIGFCPAALRPEERWPLQTQHCQHLVLVVLRDSAQHVKTQKEDRQDGIGGK